MTLSNKQHLNPHTVDFEQYSSKSDIFLYWSQKIKLVKNTEVQELLLSHEKLDFCLLRHQVTNYDSIVRSSEYRDLKGLPKLTAYHALRLRALEVAIAYQLELLEQEYQLSEQESYELRQEIHRLKLQLRDVKDEQGSKDLKIQQLLDKVDNLTIENELLKLELEDKNQQLTKLNRSNGQLIRRNEELKAELSKVNKENGKNRRWLAHYKEKANQLQIQIKQIAKGK